ncbi:MAG TPA: biotin synthase [Burkholderiaceae bacterium]|nr:biotin synthase [Burkholderiaceae bacterium]
MPNQSPPTLSLAAANRWYAVAPQKSPWLHEEVAGRMLERLQWINQQPKLWVNWGAVRGGEQAQVTLLEKYKDSECFMPLPSELYAYSAINNVAKQDMVAVKPSATHKWSLAGLFKRAPKIHHNLPADGTANMLWANMHLHDVIHPQAVLTQWQKALATDGFVMFSCLGPDTLKELRNMYVQLGWPEPSHQFTDMHDWGDMLIQAGFSQPVMDMERIVLTYETPQKLLQDLRELGRNLHPNRFPALRGKAWKAKLDAALMQHLSDPQEGGRLKLTFEIIYGHAIKPEPRVKLSEHSAVSLQDMRAMLQKRGN